MPDALFAGSLMIAYLLSVLAIKRLNDKLIEEEYR